MWWLDMFSKIYLVTMPAITGKLRLLLTYSKASFVQPELYDLICTIISLKASEVCCGLSKCYNG